MNIKPARGRLQRLVRPMATLGVQTPWYVNLVESVKFPRVSVKFDDVQRIFQGKRRIIKFDHVQWHFWMQLGHVNIFEGFDLPAW